VKTTQLPVLDKGRPQSPECNVSIAGWFIHVHVCTTMHARKYVCVYVYVCVHVYTYSCVYTYAYLYVYVYKNVYVYGVYCVYRCICIWYVVGIVLMYTY